MVGNQASVGRKGGSVNGNPDVCGRSAIAAGMLAVVPVLNLQRPTPKLLVTHPPWTRPPFKAQVSKQSVNH